MVRFVFRPKPKYNERFARQYRNSTRVSHDAAVLKLAPPSFCIHMYIYTYTYSSTIHPFSIPPTHTSPHKPKQTQTNKPTTQPNNETEPNNRAQTQTHTHKTQHNTDNRQQTTHRETTPDTRDNATKKHETCDQSHARQDETRQVHIHTHIRIYKHISKPIPIPPIPLHIHIQGVVLIGAVALNSVDFFVRCCVK